MRLSVRALLVMTLLLAAVAPVVAQGGETTELTVVTHDSFAFSETLLAQFEAETGISVRILRSGDTGTMVNQSILTRENPLGDVMYGVDNTFLSRALAADLFVPYQSPLLEFVPEDFVLEPNGLVTPVDFGDVCLNYDTTYFSGRGLDIPASFQDLTDPQYSRLLVVENPATSSPGLAFLLATIAEFGTPDDADNGGYSFVEYWEDLVANEVLVVDDWSDAYFGQFSATGGQYPMVVSYASSPPAEVFFAEEPPEEAPTGSIVADGMCFRQIEFVGILAGTEKLEAAQQFVDFLLDIPFQEDMPLQMFVFPVNIDARIPEVFEQYAALPANPATLSGEDIDLYREEWIQTWIETVLR